MSETIGTTIDVRMPQTTPPSGELALRIRGGDYHGRVVRIRASQCTVGSAPDCTLRLSGAGIRPLHCIILRSDEGAAVRRWSPDTQLNGRAFSDALLMPGDRLSVGPIDLEVLDDADLSPSRRSETAASTVPVAELAQEVVSQLRRDLRRDKSSRKSKDERRRLRQSQRRIKSLEAELERLQASVNSIAAVEQPPASQPQADIARLEAERGVWNNERKSLLVRLQEKESLTQRLERTLDELRRTIDQEQLTPATAQQPNQHEEATARQQLQARYDELLSKSQQLQQAEAAASTKVKELLERVSALEQASSQTSQDASQTSEAFQSTQRQLHETFAECERLREELHQANCALAAAQCRLTEQEAALMAFREMHQHAIAELDLECKTLQSQLADAQVKFDEQTGRLADLESYAHCVTTPEQSIPTPEQSARIAELESQVDAHATELKAVRAAKDELQLAAEQSSAEWTKREQELTERIACLERLSATLEDELRKVTSSPDKAQAAEEQRQSLEQQLAAGQRHWAEQRQLLEDQALSAHQQLHEMENQVVSMRDALRTAQSQVRERDQLLSQLRDEVRQQLALWQQERDQLRERLAAAGQASESGVSETWTPHLGMPTHLGEETNDGPAEHRYNDRQMLAGGHALAEVNEADHPCEREPSESSAPSNPSSVAEVLSRLETAGIWRPQEERSELRQPDTIESEAPTDYSPVAEATVATAESLPNFPGSPCQLENETLKVASADTFSDDSNRSKPVHEDASGQPVDVALSHRSTDKGSDEEESIEAYMARLLKRVRGDAVANAFVEQQTAAVDASSPVAPAAPSEPASAASELMPAASITPEEFLPRKSAPEQATDVKAMRELAIQSARQAITRSSQLRFQRKSLATTLGACAFAALSIGLFAWAFDTGNWLAWTGCTVSLLGTGYLTSLRLKTRRILKPIA